MGPKPELIKEVTEARMIASWFVLMMGRLTKWNFPVNGGGPGDPYIEPKEASQLAAEAIRMLSTFLPAEAGQQAVKAVESFQLEKTAAPEERMVRLGGLGAIIPSTGHKGEVPGCCVMTQQGLLCVR